MNWRQALRLICLTVVAARGISKWFGDDVLMTLVGVGMAVVIGYQIRDYIKSKTVGKRPGNFNEA